MIVHSARITYLKNTVIVGFGNDIIVTFDRRKSWSHKKYINKAMEQIGAQPGPFFRYGVDI